MRKIEELFDHLAPIVAEGEFDPESSALLLLGADEEHECGIIQGKMKSLVAMIVSRMVAEKDFELMILHSAEVFLEYREREALEKIKQS